MSSGHSAGRYMIHRLYLNRPQLRMERRLAAQAARVDSFLSWATSFIAEAQDTKPPTALMLELVDVMASIMSVRRTLERIAPYEFNDVKR